VPRLTPTEQIGLDESRLRGGRLSVEVAALSAPCLSLGVAQTGELPIARRAQELGLSVVQRSTGGTAVVCGAGDLAWSIVLPRTDRRVGADFVRAYGRLGRPVVEVLSRTIGTAEWATAPGLLEECCILSSRGEVVRTARGILGGAAQHRTGTALLHHGILHLRPDRSLLRDLWPNTPAGTFDRVAGLAEHAGFPGEETWAWELCAGLRAGFGVETGAPEPVPPDPRP
jgi:lipoate-protein ligase A